MKLYATRSDHLRECRTDDGRIEFRMFKAGAVYAEDELARCIVTIDDLIPVYETPNLQPPKIFGNWPTWITGWLEVAVHVAARLHDPKSIFVPLLTGLRKEANKRDVPSIPKERRPPIRYPVPADGRGHSGAAVVRPVASTWQSDVCDELRQWHEWVYVALPKPTPGGDNPSDDDNPPDNYAEYRNGPGGELLTSTYAKDRFGVSGKDLSTDHEAKRHRRKNPAGRNGGDYVYRYSDVCRIANRKTDDE